MDWDHQIDAVGLLCPLPVLRAARELRTMSQGQVLCLLASDPAAAIDVPHFCAEGGHAFLGTEPVDGATAYFIRRA